MCVSVFLSFVYFPYLIFSNINNRIFYWIWKFLSYCILGNVGKVNGSVSLCVHICVQVCIPAHTCAKVRGQWWLSPSVVLVLRQGLSVNLKFAALTASKLQEVSCSASSALGFQTCCPLRLFCRSGVLNSGPLACTASIFPTEPPPHLVFPFFV